MPYKYSNEEIVDILLLYGKAGGQSRTFYRIYAEQFPNRKIPVFATVHRVIQRLRDFGLISPPHEGGRSSDLRTLKIEEDILEMIEQNPRLSLRAISRALNISSSIVARTLREAQYVRCYEQPVEILPPRDPKARLKFCRWLLKRQKIDEDFVSKVLVTGETFFTGNGVKNLRNRNWSVQNPNTFFVNVWVGIVNGMLIGPFILPNFVTGKDYLLFLKGKLLELLEDVPIKVRKEMWFLHNGTPPHHSYSVVCEYLSDTFDERLIATKNALIKFPAQSFDLNPLHFFIWNYMKQLVYQAKVQSLTELKHRIDVAAEIIRLDISKAYCDSWIRRAQLCIDTEGYDFDHLL